MLEVIYKKIKINIYTIIFAACIFRIFVVIINVFNLKIKQYDAINVFVNNFINKLTYCYIFKKFAIKLLKMLFFLLYVL